MFVRVYDKYSNKHCKSMVYCMVNEGWNLRYIVLNPITSRFELIDYLDKSCNPEVPLVVKIQNDQSEFKEYKNAFLLKFKKFCRDHHKPFDITRLYGYPDTCENYEFLSELFENKSIPASRYPIQMRVLPDKDEWNYILTQQDANNFMRLFVAFHDSILTKIIYTEKSGYTNATVTFDNSGWYGIVELCFEGVQTIHIKPAKENCYNYIYDATMYVNDEIIYWTDEFMELENMVCNENSIKKLENISYEGNFIKALNLKWRKIG